MARWRPWVVISAVTWQRYCANKNGSEKPVSNCWRRVDLPGRVVHRASQGGWSKRLSLMHMGEAPPVTRPIFSMNFMMNSRVAPLRTGTVAMIDRRWKYVHYRGYVPSAAQPALQDELYDLEVDPYEEHNVIAQQVDIAANMKAAIALQLQIHGGRRE